MQLLDLQLESREIVRRIIQKRGIKNRTLAHMAEVDEQSLSKMLTGSRSMTDATLAKLAKALGVDFELLKYGEGAEEYIDSLELGANPSQVPSQEPALPYATYREDRTDYNVSNQLSRSVPNMWLVPIRVQAGFAKKFHDPIFRDQMQRVAFPMVMGECFGFEVEGRSMEPRYARFSWVVCKLIDDWSWLQKGRNYVFQTYEGIYIKQFDRVENDFIHMVSINPEFNPVEPLPLAEIRKLYAIDGIYLKDE